MAETTRTNMLSGGWKDLTYEAFRDGVTIHWINRFASDQPGVALLKYQPGASVPRHRHEGLETILVLEGSQSDETGTYGTGSFIVNAVGTEHSVWSIDGCTVLIQWDRPVTLLETQ